MSEKAANVQRKNLKDLHKAWRTMSQTYLEEKLKEVWLLGSK